MNPATIQPMAGPYLPYVVRPGDHLTKLAYARGFDADEVWNHPKNAELKKTRKPSVLLAGDVLYVPKSKPDGLSFTRRRVNRFVAQVPTTKFSMHFDDADGKLKNAKFTYEVDGVEMQGQTDGDGTASFDVPITAHEAHLVFPDVGFATTAKIGHLDPIDDPKGVRQRLKNKGYIKEPPSEDEEKEAALLAAALTQFQKDQKLPPTGELDDTTKAKLSAEHGS